MPKPLPADYLQPGESVLHQQGRHPLSVLDALLSLTILWGAAVGLTVLGVQLVPRATMASVGIPLIAAFTILYVGACVAQWWRMQTSRYVVTPERVYKAYGRLRFFLLQTTYDKVTDMHVKQSLFGRVWNFGTVRLQTAGAGLAMEGVRDPFRVKQGIEAARTNFLAELLSEHRGQPVTQTESQVGEASADEPVWTGSPAPASFVGALLGVATTLMMAFTLTLAGSLTGENPPLLMGIGLFLFATAQGAGAWVRFRYTRFEVRRRGVVVTSGWLTRRRVETTYDKVTDVTTYEDILGRVLNYGRITINTAGSNEAPVVFFGLKDNDQIKALIDETRNRRRPS